MLKEGRLIGVFGIYRQEVRPFSDDQIGLVTNFANQASYGLDIALAFERALAIP
jgi:two-component system, NtrC family, sensor kinase